MDWESCGNCRHMKECMVDDDEFDFSMICDEYNQAEE